MAPPAPLHRCLDCHPARARGSRAGGGLHRPGGGQGGGPDPAGASDLPRRAARRERRARVRVARPGLSRPDHRGRADAARVGPRALLSRPADGPARVRHPGRSGQRGRSAGGRQGAAGVSRHRGVEPQGHPWAGRAASGRAHRPVGRRAARSAPALARPSVAARRAPRGASARDGRRSGAGPAAAGVRRAAGPAAHAHPRPER